MSTVIGRSSLNIAVCVAALLFCYAYVFHIETARALTAEDGLIEWSTSILYFIASGLFIAAARRHGWKNIWLWGFALMFFFAGGEEISWGQRVIDLETPATLRELNVQQEFNLHNLDGIHQHVRLIGVLIVCGTCFFIPLTNRLFPWFRKLYGQLHFPLYPLWFVAAPFLALLYMVIPRLILDRTIFSTDEFGEFLLSVSFLIFALSVFGNGPAQTISSEDPAGPG